MAQDQQTAYSDQKQDQDQQSRQEQFQPSQAMFDTDFQSLIGQARGIDTSRIVADQYWELAQQTLHTARRVSEVQALSLMQGQIVREVTASVLSEIRRNPSLVRGKGKG